MSEHLIERYKTGFFNYDNNDLTSLRHHYCVIVIKCNRCGVIWKDRIFKHKMRGCLVCDKDSIKCSTKKKTDKRSLIKMYNDKYRKRKCAINLQNKFKTDFKSMLDSFDNISLKKKTGDDNLELEFSSMTL